MSALRTPLMTLDPPYRLRSDQLTYRFIGWSEVDDPMAPNIRLAVNGVDVPLSLTSRPDVQSAFPNTVTSGFFAEVDFRKLFGSAGASEPFLLEATLTSDTRRRRFEYAVTDQWLAAVFGRPMRARRMPPEHLQIRVAGAAAGEFHRTGVAVADRIQGLLSQIDRPLESYEAILDFGCGPGRVLQALKDLNPSAGLYGADIDPEAISWARRELPDIAEFRVNAAEPPLPFPSEAFDLIICVSVFTHLPWEMQWPWLADLRRSLKPGGVLLTTKLDPDNEDLPREVRSEGVAEGFVYWGEADLTEGLPEFYRLAYHTEEYIRRHWGRYFEVLHVGSRDLNNTQDAIVLRRPRHALSWLPLPVRRKLYPVKAWLLAAA